MGIIDKYLLGKKGRDEDVFPPIGPSDSDTEDAMGSLQEAYGLPAAAPPPQGGPEPAPTAPVAGPVQAAYPPEPPTDAGGGTGSPPPATPDAPPVPKGDSSDGLDSSIRDLFTEHATYMDPQLETLLGRVGDLNARDLANELRELSKSIGADQGRRPTS